MTRATPRALGWILLAAALGCSDGSNDGDDGSSGGAAGTSGGTGTAGSPSAGGAGGSGGSLPADFEPTAADFDCIRDWPKVRNFRITNKLGQENEAVAVAEASGGPYPPGTFIQLIPQEAMVKRLPGFSAETNDWEFFFLEVSESGTVIADRGTTETVNSFGGNCFGCHSAADAQYDLVCEQGRGCADIPIPPDLSAGFQENDPRCQ